MSKLVLNGLGKNFGKMPAVQDVSLTLQEGEFVSLLGPVWLRQDHDAAHDCRVHQPYRGHYRDEWCRAVLAQSRGGAGKARHVDDLPELRDLAEYDGGAERRVRFETTQAAG